MEIVAWRCFPISKSWHVAFSLRGNWSTNYCHGLHHSWYVFFIFFHNFMFYLDLVYADGVEIPASLSDVDKSTLPIPVNTTYKH